MTIQNYSKTQCLDLFCNVCVEDKKQLHGMNSENEGLCKRQGLTLAVELHVHSLCVAILTS